MKKLLMLLGFVFAFSISAPSIFAKGTEEKVSEEKLNTFLMESGAPEDLLERWGYDQKLDLYEKGKDGKVEFDTTNTSEFVNNPITGQLEKASTSGGISLFGTIPSSDLKVSHDIWSLYYDGVKYKSVYANYSWSRTGTTKGDKLAIAVPSGWSIVAKSYVCKEFQSSWPDNGYSQKASCGGSTYDLDFYGAVWSLTRTDKVWHQGWASLEMKRTSTKAQLKVLSKYVDNTGVSTSWSIGWGPMSVSISGNKSNNQVAWDTAFTY